MTRTPDRPSRLDPDERRRLREILERTTPAQRLAWLEEAIAFAHRAGALPRREPRWLPREEFARRIGALQADPGLREDLAELAPDTTDDLREP